MFSIVRYTLNKRATNELCLSTDQLPCVQLHAEQLSGRVPVKKLVL